jgi:hypothetical protein
MLIVSDWLAFNIRLADGHICKVAFDSVLPLDLATARL